MWCSSTYIGNIYNSLLTSIHNQISSLHHFNLALITVFNHCIFIVYSLLRKDKYVFIMWHVVQLMCV
jgi:hypothetical protein